VQIHSSFIVQYLKHGGKWRFSALKFEKVEISGLIVLFIGVVLLAATFYSAFVFLVADVTILTSVDIAELFGNALAPLIKAIIHILYLGIMGWVGSILTIRAVQLLKKEKEATVIQPQARPEAKQSSTAPASSQLKPEIVKEIKETKKAETPEQTASSGQYAELQKEATVEKAPEKAATS